MDKKTPALDVADQSEKRNVAHSFATRYGNSIILRSAVQMIPTVGGALDAIVGGYASKINQARIDEFLQSLSARLSKIEHIVPIEPSEEFLDFLRDAMEAVIRGKSSAKRQAICSIVANQISWRRPWDQASTATRILADLEVSHIEILRAAVQSEIVQDGGFEGLRIVALGLTNQPALMTGMSILPSLFPELDSRLIENNVAELVARSLLRDEGSGRYSVRPFWFFAPTELGAWFLEWIESPSP